MRVAVLADIHGNLPALEAVLRDVEAAGVDAVVLGGDLADGPMPAQTHGRTRRDPVEKRLTAKAQNACSLIANPGAHDIDRLPAPRSRAWPPTAATGPASGPGGDRDPGP
jgi:predicted phosphodiesterase